MMSTFMTFGEKVEMQGVLDTEKNAKIIYELYKDVNRDYFRVMSENGQVEKYLLLVEI